MISSIDKSRTNRLIFLFTITYMVSYLTRINYGAIISEMEKATAISRDLLSMSVTGSFITYGAGQIVSGVLGDKISPKRLMTIGLCLTVGMNTILPFLNNPFMMLTVWCVNGFAQSFMWPPLVRLMSSLLSDEEYKIAGVRVSWGSSIGTMLIYLLSPLIISTLSWHWVFWSAAICGLIMIIVWCIFIPNVRPVQKESHSPTSKNATRVLFSPVMIAIMVAIIAMGMLRDGVTTWMPTYISETYQLDNVISILTGVALPLFAILSFQVASGLYRRRFTNPITCAGVIFAIGVISSVGILIFSGSNAMISVAFFAILTGSMHGVNLMLIMMLPNAFKKYGNISTVSGVLNACTYIGSALSTYGVALISQRSGWSTTIIIWVIIASVGTAICFICARSWSKQHAE